LVPGDKLEGATSSQDLAKPPKSRMRKTGGILRKAKSTGQNLMTQLSNFDFKTQKVTRA